jgi:hypothetical protein
MDQQVVGRSTSDVEVTNVSKHGFWLLVQGRELFLPFEDFPWFEEVPISQVLNVQLLHADHLYWPDLDVDLSVASIEHPQDFPLVSSAILTKRIQPPRKRRARG